MGSGFWWTRPVFCKVMLFIQYVSCLVSIENIVLSAVDRYGAVVFPIRLSSFLWFQVYWIQRKISELWMSVETKRFDRQLSSCSTFCLSGSVLRLNNHFLLYNPIQALVADTPSKRLVNALKHREKRQNIWWEWRQLLWQGLSYAFRQRPLYCLTDCLRMG